MIIKMPFSSIMLLISILLGSCIPMELSAQSGTININEFKIDSVEYRYYNELGEEITKEEYNEQLDYRYNLNTIQRYDTLIVSRLYPRERFGRLRGQKLIDLQNMLQASVGQKIDFSEDICIGFFTSESYAKEDCKYFYLFDKRFNRMFRKINYIRVVDEEVVSEKEHYNYLLDKDDFFKKMFFKNEVTCDNWFAIRPNGDYRTFIGDGGANICYDFNKEWTDEYIEKYIKKMIRK